MKENSPDPKVEKPWLVSLLAAMPHGVAFLDASWTIIWANQEFWELTGMAGEKSDVNLESLIPDWGRMKDGILYAFQEKKNRRVRETVEINSQGVQKRMAFCVAQCHPDLDATWSVSLTDISEEAQLRQELEDRRQSYSFIRGFTSDLIIRTDDKMNICWSNQAALRMFCVNRPLSTYIDQSSILHLEKIIDNNNTATDGTKIEIQVNKKNGAIYYLSGVCRKLFDESGIFLGLSIILHDDSDQKHFEDLAERLEMSPREKEIMDYVLQGYSNLNIATILGLSESGVKFHIRNVFGRAKVNTRTEFMAMLIHG